MPEVDDVKRDVNISPALEDIKEMVEARPELSQEDWETVEKAIPWLKASLKPTVRKELEVEYAQKYAEYQVELKTVNTEYINSEFAKMRKERDPLSKDELEKLLSQEYTEFPVKLLKDGNEIKFVIRELPHAIEDKFLKILKKYLVPVLQDSNNIKFKLDGTMLDRINSLLDGSIAAFKMASELVVIILDPLSRDKDITPEWISNNISIFRLSAIILAQFEANKYRDFLFQGFQTFQSLKTGR